MTNRGRQAIRIIHLVFRMSDGWFSTAELAEELAVCARCIRNDLLIMAGASIPVMEEQRGRITVYRIQQGWLQRYYLDCGASRIDEGRKAP